MQSWGTQSRFSNRDSDLEPSKSGVIGLICAAMGIPREDPEKVKELAGLKMGIRVDRQGTLKRDYHTALNVAKAGGGKPKDCEPSERFYLSDACF
jgi:CRISPR system Cascade subunit CasD